MINVAIGASSSFVILLVILSSFGFRHYVQTLPLSAVPPDAYFALASIVSVTLGVATMIVVNSVMEGFSREMQTRIHGILSDVIITGSEPQRLLNVPWHEEQIRRVAGD